MYVKLKLLKTKAYMTAAHHQGQTALLRWKPQPASHWRCSILGQQLYRQIWLVCSFEFGGISLCNMVEKTYYTALGYGCQWTEGCQSRRRPSHSPWRCLLLHRVAKILAVTILAQIHALFLADAITTPEEDSFCCQWRLLDVAEIISKQR